MSIIFHIGARGAFGIHLNHVLNTNKQFFESCSVCSPAEAVYKPIFRDIINGKFNPLPDEHILYDFLEPTGLFDRMILSNQHYWTSPENIVVNNIFYPEAAPRLEKLAEIFITTKIKLVLEIECLSTFFPQFEDTKLGNTLSNMSKEVILKISWFELVNRMALAFPNAEIEIIVAEIAPIIFPEIIESFVGRQLPKTFTGAHRYLARSLNNAGQKRLAGLLPTSGLYGDGISQEKAQMLLANFEVNPDNAFWCGRNGWDKDFLDLLNQNYRRDIFQILSLHNTTIFRDDLLF